MRVTDDLKWASFVLFLAALYNVAWGAIAVVAPREMLGFLGVYEGFRVEFWQCIGMLVAVYGLGYWFAATDPVRYWPIVLVGLSGKVLGPLGGIWSTASGGLPASFIWVNVTNDLVWLAPFGWVLWAIYRRRGRAATNFSPLDSQTPLYRRVLGDTFDNLKPRIRRFHNARQPIEVRGVFCVTRGSGTIASWLTDLSGFPRSQESIDVSLIVEPNPRGERWRRVFGSSIIESWQCEAHGFLAERFGALVMYLQPRVVDGALEVTDVRSTFLGVPLPPFLTPRVYAHGVDRGDGIEISVEITASPFGLLVAYQGSIVVTDTPARPDA